jgi:hypothetical protein
MSSTARLGGTRDASPSESIVMAFGVSGREPWEVGGATARVVVYVAGAMQLGEAIVQPTFVA